MSGKNLHLGLSFRQWLITGLLLALVSAGALIQTIKGREAHYQEFLRRAERIGQALEAFARDHAGGYPNDGRDNHSPPGLSPHYIQWQEEWNIDYEVHDNGRGGKYVALEYLGPFKPGQSFHSSGLTKDPEKRRRYGRGQPIPGSLNRIWVFHEEAPIFEDPSSSNGAG